MNFKSEEIESSQEKIKELEEKNKLKNSYLCEFENCEVSGDLKIITLKEAIRDRRARFCSIEHAIGWLQARLKR